MVGVMGVEPTRAMAPDPKSGASANSATPPNITMVGREGVEPPLFLMCLIYSQVSSPTRHTFPNIMAEDVGIEPTRDFSPNCLANSPLRPLG